LRVGKVQLRTPDNMQKAVSQLDNTQVGDGELIEESPHGLYGWPEGGRERGVLVCRGGWLCSEAQVTSPHTKLAFARDTLPFSPLPASCPKVRLPV